MYYKEAGREGPEGRGGAWVPFHTVCNSEIKRSEGGGEVAMRRDNPKFSAARYFEISSQRTIKHVHNDM